MLTQRIKVSNERSSSITLWLEPWGEDYGMSPGDAFEVLAANVAEGFYFHVSSDEKGMKIYAEGDANDVSVYQSGKMLSCGHNRREETW
jgi:hypothetical protein